MYTREQKEKALAMYDATQSIAEVIRRLGYPSKQALYTWIANRDKPWQKPNGFRGVNTAEHPRHPSVNLNFSEIRACFEEGNDVQLISANIAFWGQKADCRDNPKSLKVSEVCSFTNPEKEALL